MKNLALLLFILLLVSCKTPESVQTSQETFRFIEREVRDTTISGFTVKTELSIPEVLERRIYDTLRITDPKTKGELLLWKNKYGDLVAQCTSQDQTITKLKERLVDYESRQHKEVIQVDTRNWWQKLIGTVPWYVFLVAGFVLGLVLRFRPL